jgi:hypothetical protein
VCSSPKQTLPLVSTRARPPGGAHGVLGDMLDDLCGAPIELIGDLIEATALGIEACEPDPRAVAQCTRCHGPSREDLMM